MDRAAATRAWLELDAAWDEARLVGGKAARLVELKRQGFQVPDGFDLTTKLFGNADAARAAVAEALPRLGAAMRLAVRSSASAARVAASSRRRVGGEAGAVAVLVQRLVDADAAGVAYSANPVTGDHDEAGISAVRGLGERVVAGEAAPYEWMVRRHAAICTRRSEGSIDSSQAKRIAQLARDVADRMGGPQDIESALAGDELFLLQVRPITALPDAVGWKSSEPGVFLRNFRLAEWLGDPITSLFESWLLERMEISLWQQLGRFGVQCRPPYHVVVNGWYFYSGGSYLDLLRGLYTPQLGAGAHAVLSLDWCHATLGELALEVEPAEATQSRHLRLAAARERAESAARVALQAYPKVLAEFDQTLAMAQRLQPLRDEQSLDLTLGWPLMRRALRRLGAHLVARQVIDEPDEIYFLTKEEEATRGTGGLGATARGRRETWEHQRRLTPPLMLGEFTPKMQRIADEIAEEFVPRPGRSDNPDALLGYPAGAGRATGPGRIMRGNHDFDRLQPGDVLVAPVTTPAWTLLFTCAVAVVTDTGSVGSDASQVAREYGIPAVVCTGDATGRLADRQLVTVEGSAGVVTPVRRN